MAFGDADASTPAFASVNTNWTSTGATTASFTPPAGSLVVLFVYGDTSAAANPGNETVTDSAAGSTGWTFKIRRAKPDAGSQAGTVAWWEKVYAASPGAITVTVVGNATGAASGGFKTHVVANCSGSEGHAEGSNTAAAVSLSITSTTNNARGVVAATDWNVQANMLAGTGQTALLASSVGSGPDTRVYLGIQNAVTSPAGSVTMSTASPTSGNANNFIGGFFTPSSGTNATATPSTVAATAAVPTPTVSTGSVVTLATVTGSATVPTPTVALGVAITPTTVTAAATVPTPAFASSVAIAPASVAAAATVPAPTVATGSTVVLGAAVVASAAVPTPSVSASGNASVSLPTVVATATVPTPTVSTGSKVTLSAAVTATAAVPTPVFASSVAVQLQQVIASATLTAPTVSTGSTVAPSGPVAAVAAVPVPSVTTATTSTGLVGEAHGPLPLAVGAITVHTGTIAGAVT